ncbi:electron transport complex subunit RsxG [Gayadomonas joobiniege]|uniref:electron transport complex subunit RsxG n=1 Tax=Gayadomonas joobiniege TaxID=1234606 RepID=UPI00035DBD79|nr:electron transport complex subunit RsxG [Gayadomonas joobiniege]
MPIKNITRSSIILTLFALVTTGLTAWTFILTKDRIAAEKENAIVRNINQIIAANLYDNDVANDCIVRQNHLQKKTRIFRARQAQTNVALAIETFAPDGYSGRIDLLVAVDSQFKILGVRTTAHNETPGLGDKIEVKKSNWIKSFNGLSIEPDNLQKWAVRKDGGMFDAFTGATITPRAVVNAVKDTLLWAQQQPDLFSQAANCGVEQ